MKKIEIYPKSSTVLAFIAATILLFCSGCITDLLYLVTEKKEPYEAIDINEPRPESSQTKTGEISSAKVEEEENEVIYSGNEEKEKTSGLPEKEEAENTISSVAKADEEPVSKELQDTIPASTSQNHKKSDQEMLDSALEFCQASSDFWEQGDLENAIDALDQAYSLILKVNPESNPNLLQQREDLRFTISKRIIEVYSSRFTAANGHSAEIPLVMNEHVEKALSLFKTKEKKFFIDSYRRSGRYRPTILKVLKEAGLPEELSWLPLIESGFKVRALSRARALGLWQFIASTGYKFGLKRDRWIDERMDPEKSTKAAIAYLQELHQIFGDWTTALAAYNCGEGTVLKSIRTQKISYLDNFWDLYEKLPMETVFYVPKFLAVLHILSDPEAHGFSLPPVEEEFESENVIIEKQVHLKTISKHLEVPYKTLKDLNPSLRHDYTPSRPYEFKVPKGKGELLFSKLGDIPVWSPPVPAYVLHRVRRGESLSTIAEKYRTSVRSIMAMNRLKNVNYIKEGWKLKIPTSKVPASLDKAYPVTTRLKAGEKSIEYVVRKGDSLWKIADRFNTTTHTIQSINQLNSSHLTVGQVLMIPRGMTVSKNIKTKPYTVLKGDSPYKIATKYKMNLSEFLSINDLSPRSTIFPGQILLVKAE